MKSMLWQAAPGLLAALLLSGWAEAQSTQVYSLGSPVPGLPSQLKAPGPAGPPAAASPGFDAVDETQAVDTPPDPNIAISPKLPPTGDQYIVETVNQGLRVFRPDGTPVSGYTPFVASVDGFFRTTGDPEVNVFDPRLVFDPYAQRFFIIALENDFDGNQGYIHIAVSSSADPRGPWHTFRAALPPTSTTYYPDYPSLGMDRQAIYLGVNLFEENQSTKTPPKALLYRAIDKTSMLWSTNPQITRMVDVVETTTKPQYHWSMRAAQAYGLPSDAPAEGLFIGTFREENQKSTLFSKLRVVKVRRPLDPPRLSFTAFDVAVPAYREPSLDGPQKSSCGGSSQTLDVSSGQLLNAVWRGNDLYAAHTVPLPSSVNSIRWYQIRTGPPDAPVTWSQLVQDGEIRGASSNQHTYLPTVGVDAKGSLVIAHAQSSPAEPVSFWIASRSTCGAPGQMQSRDLIKVADHCYKEVVQDTPPYRWGDYWSVAVDPASPTRLWAVGEYVKAENLWGTWIVPVEVPPGCPDCACSW